VKSAASPHDAAMEGAARLYAAGDLEGAGAACRAILRSDARYFFALHLLATIAAREERWEECLRHATDALALDPRHVEVLCNRGAALRMLGRPAEALGDYDRALSLAPGKAEIVNNRGVALAALNRHAEAIECYGAALAVAPDYARAGFNRSLSRLVSGDFEGGWADHENRWRGGDRPMQPTASNAPRWTGREEIRGKTILVGAEQGLGDILMCSRYVRLLRERGARVVLEAHAPLKALLQGMEGVDQVIAVGEALPPHDYQVPIMSLPLAFGTRVDTIPRDVPYVSAPPGHVERWRSALEAARRPLVGLAWSGGITLRNDRNRSIPLAQLQALRDAEASFVSLQKDIRVPDRPQLATGRAMLHFEAELADFRDTAALVSLMDVVVSVDTSVAHLAGAMAKPTWILLPFSPDWRWLLGRDDSPWYPTARLFRQPQPGDWDTPIRRLAEALRALPRG
jgi:hypothetical protein